MNSHEYNKLKITTNIPMPSVIITYTETYTELGIHSYKYSGTYNEKLMTHRIEILILINAWDF